jgi:prepilin-type N-terminal cleavage/methylation domain-containing protein
MERRQQRGNGRSGKNRRARGFTLTELLMVIVIIGILATIAVARYVDLREKSLVAAAAYDLDLVRKLLAYYSVDYSAYPVAVSSYDDLQNQLVDPDGKPYGELPYSNTFAWISYDLGPDGLYTVRVQASDNRNTILVATPDAIHPE